MQSCMYHDSIEVLSGLGSTTNCSMYDDPCCKYVLNSGSYYQCLDQCNFNSQYLLTVFNVQLAFIVRECVVSASCPPTAYPDNKYLLVTGSVRECATTCPNYVENNTCVDSCSLKYNSVPTYNLFLMSSGMKKCIISCSDSTCGGICVSYSDVSGCSSLCLYQYVHEQVCNNESCSAFYTIDTNNKYICSDSCPNFYLRVNDVPTQCVLTCSQNLYVITNSIKVCANVSECTYRVQQADGIQCVPSCL